MISFKQYFLSESLDSPYQYDPTFSYMTVEKEDDDGNVYIQEVFKPTQKIRFTTDNGTPYLWYARHPQFSQTDDVWEIAFGIETGKDIRGNTKIDIETTNTGDAFRVFSTVLQILNDFIELDENYEIRLLIFTSEGKNRTKLYEKRFIPLINKFRLDLKQENGDTTQFVLERTH